jgi:hypothetical protein
MYRVFIFVLLLKMVNPSYAGCIGNFSFPGGVKPPKTLCGDIIEEFYLLEKESLTFLVFGIVETNFRKWAKECNFFEQLETIEEPIEVTSLIKNQKKSRYFEKEIWVDKGYFFIWDSENYRGSIIYDMKNLIVYVESLRMREN